VDKQVSNSKFGLFLGFGADSIRISQEPFLAEDCLTLRVYQGPLTRKLPLKLDESAAIDDPKPSFDLMGCAVYKDRILNHDQQ
jgi:hypothetical protein